MEIYLIVFCCLALALGALMLILRSAKKFRLTEDQLKKIKARELEQQQKDKAND